MAQATSYTQAQIDQLNAAQQAQIDANTGASIDTAGTDANGHLTLTRKDSSVIDAGIVGTPTGSVVMFAAAAAPAGWLLCDGSAVSRTTYSALFTLIGTRFGVGNGSTTFNLPNMQARFPHMDTANLGVAGGNASHTHAMNSHDHSLSGGSPIATAHIRMVTGPSGNILHERVNTGTGNWTGTQKTDLSGLGYIGGSSDQSGDGTVLGGNTAQGGAAPSQASDPAADLPPYLNLNFIIKT